jgi:hypothetical protein
MRVAHGSGPATHRCVAGGCPERVEAHCVLAGRVATVIEYEVRARRWAHGWELAVHDERGEVGVTQSRTLAGAERMVRDYVALSEDVEPHSFGVIVTVDLDGDLAGEAEAIREAIRRAEDAQRDAAARSRQLALRLKASGLTGADIAVILRVSPQRVSQLLSSARARLVS